MYVLFHTFYQFNYIFYFYDQEGILRCFSFLFLSLSLSEFWLRKFRFKVRFLRLFLFSSLETHTDTLSLVTTSDFSGIACVNSLVVLPVVFVLFF
jgi:hypothetical protein